jgi:hypothetical protein
MPTTIDLTDQELTELKAFTHQADASQALRLAMTAYLRLARRQQLKALSGQVTMEEGWRSLEAAELGSRDDESGLRPH